jgi:hypothetical protein
LAAAQEMLDEEYEDLEQDEQDDNLYSLGRIGRHNVVIVCLPAGLIGNNPAATLAIQMRATFKVFFRASANLGSPDIRHRGDSSQSFLGLVSGLEICEPLHNGKGGLGVLCDFSSCHFWLASGK